jgi:hypothetical protein
LITPSNLWVKEVLSKQELLILSYEHMDESRG